ncbi:glycerol kinase [Aspergillus fischeri NRRL 181]|uniref:glycerol kinase n=1 Tax=Neosartorya fischeri (strain ATCC 1020 / DSM 3700 / CBS 544.65 / FGSC A1164 / JCM 1740 / NRRL 181 / WB 181) TaxID=331117 RepID=A1DMP5_NEOFI|nr:glycerol kinase, putative [Aspergillus fischeri NRRL 181]EAW16066.1 glycerol kinase, putative [Aspergillus fischeri NRRL 181]
MQPSEIFVGSIDQGTTSSRFLIFNRDGEPVASHQVEFTQIYPNPGWHEHDPFELVSSVETCIEEAVKQFESEGYSRYSVKAIGITNQRETTVVWDHETGEPLYNAIVWTDTRPQAIVHELKQKREASQLQPICGLPLTTYSSATKLLWMIEHVPKVKDAYERGTLAFGTVDAWLVYRLNGGASANVFVSDPTNASRTMFMNLETLQYDNFLLDFFGIRGKVHLPKIVPSSDAKAYGALASGTLAGVPIMGCLGDQSSALVGQKGFSPGMAKNTYGTGCFLLYNVGEKPVISEHGLLATVAYHFDGKPVYALEGSIAVAGSGIKFLQNNLNFFQESKEVNDLAQTVEDSGGCVFVTAFSGLYAPYWIDDAKGTMFGITQYTQKGHIARATLEATCFQTKAILDAMEKDSGHALSELAVDGGMSNSDLAMQIQADLISIPVYRPKMRETTALGAAIAAGLAVGVWRNFAELRDINRAGGAVFEPKISREESAKSFARWEKAVAMCKGWSGDEPPPPVQPSQKEIKKNAPEVVSNHNAINATPPKFNGELTTPKFPLISISGDLDDADEEDLYLELRKIEILQRLKKLRKLKLSFY